MAKAQPLVKEVERTFTVTETEVTGIQLELTTDEALYVTAMLGRGNPHKIGANVSGYTPFNALYDALGLGKAPYDSELSKKYRKLYSGVRTYLSGE
jgi:hypothetical protein